MTDEQVARLDGRIDDLGRKMDDRFAEVDQRFEKLERKMDSGFDTLGRQMRVLHEDVIDRIKTITDPTEILRREMRAGDAAVREETDHRLRPLELTVRAHSADISRLKKRRPGRGTA